MDSEELLPDETHEASTAPDIAARDFADPDFADPDFAAPDFAAMSFTYAAPAPEPQRPVGGILASIVPVRSYDGETEEQALERSGIDINEPGREVTYVHIS